MNKTAFQQDTYHPLANRSVQHKIAILKNKQNVIITFHLLHVITILINKESIIITFQDMGDLSTDTTLQAMILTIINNDPYFCAFVAKILPCIASDIRSLMTQNTRWPTNRFQVCSLDWFQMSCRRKAKSHQVHTEK